MQNLKIKNIAVILVSVDFGQGDHADRLHELQQLAVSAKLHIVATIQGKRTRPDSTTYIGSGKVAELVHVITQTQAELVVFNHDLSPAQQRNLSLRLNCHVIDRTSLILDLSPR